MNLTLNFDLPVEQFKEIQDSLCVSQRNKLGDEERVILFLQMAPGIAFSDEIVRTVKSSIRQQLSARHLPAVVLPTNEIPASSSCHSTI